MTSVTSVPWNEISTFLSQLFRQSNQSVSYLRFIKKKVIIIRRWYFRMNFNFPAKKSVAIFRNSLLHDIVFKSNLHFKIIFLFSISQNFQRTFSFCFYKPCFLSIWFKVWFSTKFPYEVVCYTWFSISSSIFNNAALRCVKSVRIQSYSGPHSSRIFPNSDWIRIRIRTEYGEIRIQSECGKMPEKCGPE